MEARPGPPLIAHAEHPFCFVCSSLNPMGLALHFVTEEDESVSATFLARISHAHPDGASRAVEKRRKCGLEGTTPQSPPAGR
jgi:hypothetical protein